MINQMLLELLSQLSAEHLEIFLLLARLLRNLDDLLVDVPTEEGRALSRVLLRLLHLLQDLAYAAFLALLDLLNLAHDVLEEVLDEHLRLFVAVQALVDLHADHLTQLVRYLGLIVLEAIDFVADRVIDLGDFAAKGNFLLRACHLLLADPAVDAADLRLQVGLNR